MAIDLKKAAEVRIDVQDWRDEAIADEGLISDHDELLEQIADGAPTGKVAKRVVISRLLEVAPADLISADKSLFYHGARAEVSRIVRQEKTTVKAANGKEYAVPRFVGQVVREEEGAGEGITFASEIPSETTEVSYVDLDANEMQAALERAQEYLRGPVIGHIWNRLTIIYKCKGPVRDDAARLKNEIDVLVGKLLVP